MGKKAVTTSITMEAWAVLQQMIASTPPDAEGIPASASSVMRTILHDALLKNKPAEQSQAV